MDNACAVFKLQFGGESPRTLRAWQAGGYPPPLAFPDSMALVVKLQFIDLLRRSRLASPFGGGG